MAALIPSHGHCSGTAGPNFKLNHCQPPYGLTESGTYPVLGRDGHGLRLGAGPGATATRTTPSTESGVDG